MAENSTVVELPEVTRENCTIPEHCMLSMAWAVINAMAHEIPSRVGCHIEMFVNLRSDGATGIRGGILKEGCVPNTGLNVLLTMQITEDTTVDTVWAELLHAIAERHIGLVADFMRDKMQESENVVLN